MNNDELYQKAMDAITELFSDMSVSRAKCRENLNSLKSEIDLILDTLQNDEEEGV